MLLLIDLLVEMLYLATTQVRQVKRQRVKRSCRSRLATTPTCPNGMLPCVILEDTWHWLEDPNSAVSSCVVSCRYVAARFLTASQIHNPHSAVILSRWYVPSFYFWNKILFSHYKLQSFCWILRQRAKKYLKMLNYSKYDKFPKMVMIYLY